MTMIDESLPAPPPYEDTSGVASAARQHPRRSARTRVTRCVIAALVGAIAVLSWQVYEYRTIVSVLQKAVAQQNVLLDRVIETQQPTDLSGAG